MDRVTAILAVAVVLILRANILLAVEPISEFIEVEIGATYEAGEDDSKNDALYKAKAKAQREAAEEIVGVFLQGFTEVAGYQAVKDSISMFSQALLRSKTLEKNYECAPNCVATVKLRVKVKRS